MSEAQPNMMRRRLGHALETLRQRTGMNLEDLAAKADIYASQVIPGILRTHDYAHAVH
ncbi:Scr1 family TA system antitoxin-like transcriptional regulator [Streptomyces decoyicus]|uniref:Scr1 family TA system antitoxin-like transcriptional regulator n=1 Tax=Streptomyces decoyicus TaxID=249567 RepID=UPI002E17E16C|nr:hypothetical protein OG532_38825 [Streptomyces decoyicus]